MGTGGTARIGSSRPETSPGRGGNGLRIPGDVTASDPKGRRLEPEEELWGRRYTLVRLQYWIEEDVLAGGSCPSEQRLGSVRKEFPALISLLEDDRQYLYDPTAAQGSFSWFRVPMTDHATPSLGQLVLFYEGLWSLPRNTPAYVHCLAGIGRTGTVAASHLVWRGWEIETALAQVDSWTHGLYSREIALRVEEIRDLLERFRHLFQRPWSRPATGRGRRAGV